LYITSVVNDTTSENSDRFPETPCNISKQGLRRQNDNYRNSYLFYFCESVKRNI